MNLLEEYENGIKGLRLQAKVATDSLISGVQTDKKQLAEAHRLIALSPNILKSKMIKLFMEEKGFCSYPDIDMVTFKTWVFGRFEYDHSRIIAISAIKESDEMVHFSDGFQELTQDGNKLDFLELSSYSLCGKAIHFFGGSHFATALVNNISGTSEFIKECGFKLEKMCPKCLKLINLEIDELLKN